MTTDEAAQVVALALAAYPTQAGKISGSAITAMRAMWADLLGDLEFGAIKAALQVYCRSAKWLPSPAELRELVASGGAATRSGIDAWGDVRKAVSRFGVYRRPQFTDALVAKAVDAVGWDAICNSEAEGVERAHFARAYERFAVDARTTAQVGALARQALREATGAVQLDGMAGDLAKMLTAGKAGTR